MHLTKFIDDLMGRQAKPEGPSCTGAHAHTSPQDSVQPHTTSLRLPLTLPETHSQQDSSTGDGGVQAETEVTAASRSKGHDHLKIVVEIVAHFPLPPPSLPLTNDCVRDVSLDSC